MLFVALSNLLVLYIRYCRFRLLLLASKTLPLAGGPSTTYPPLGDHSRCLSDQVLQHADDTTTNGGGGTAAENVRAKKGGGGADFAGLPPPPDKGCPCVVLRTGFETSQGQLMKTILFATKRVAAGSDWETGVFILILLVFAAVASAFVLAEVRALRWWGGRGGGEGRRWR